ncbi:MAG: HAMP domain-containing histidine kinase [Dorea sp.]|uniref:sensor histidine kinase n=1 Tax=Sporofaciens musculi TaxID=2681861 RepID=UPI00216E5BEC|nr:sensor histidine kinase [Sporofaciens musculi]MCI9422551.1 HAMP domain-containing histidine kinase [Dorea sp.]
MSDDTILFFLTVLVLILFLIILYQRFVFRRGIQTKLRQINEKLEEIAETDSDEKVMIFTDHPVLMELGAQINRLLVDRQRIKADFKREEISSKKMLSNISHDIKTPLTVILGYLEIMRLSNAEDEMLIKTEAKAKQVMAMINQFFTLAKLEAGDMDISLCKINICEVCRENVLEFYDILLQKEFKVDLVIPESAVYVQGDKDALQRILYNLLSNVIRYGSYGKYLGVFLRQEKSAVYIDVVDKGKGIEKEFTANVFDRLYTMEDSRNREIQGNGLGLTIARNLAVQLGGDLTLDSIPNVKTTFTVRLKRIR